MSTITKVAQTPQVITNTPQKPAAQKSDTVTISQPTISADELKTTATKGKKATTVSLVEKNPFQNFIKGATDPGALLFGGVIGAGVVGTLGNSAKVFTNPKALLIGGGVALGIAATIGAINMAQGGAMEKAQAKAQAKVNTPPAPGNAPSTAPPSATAGNPEVSTGGKVDKAATQSSESQPTKTDSKQAKNDGDSHVLAGIGAATGIVVGAIVGARTGSFNNFVYTASAITFVGLMLDKLAN